MCHPTSSLTRREFIGQATVAAVAMTVGAHAAGTFEPKFSVLGFSHSFRHLNAEESAELVAEVGWDGLEIPVRVREGQILPERAPDELPAFEAALRRRGKTIGLLATGITSMTEPHAETVLRTAAKIGVRKIRLGSFRYAAGAEPLARLREIAPAMRDILAACDELGLEAGLQNHSGWYSVGAPVWDIVALRREFGLARLGIFFDIGHAVVEGGLSWPIQAKLTESYCLGICVKDFVWAKGARGWQPNWCPLGEGMVPPAYFERLAAANFSGPISQYHEYPLGDRPRMVAAMQRDFKTLKEWLAK